MSNVPAFIIKHPVLSYFALAFGISWGGGLLVLGPGGIPTTVERLMTMGPVLYVAMLAGPSVAGRGHFVSRWLEHVTPFRNPESAPMAMTRVITSQDGVNGGRRTSRTWEGWLK